MIPGLSRLPAAGEYDASPALARLIRSTPADELADRYPGRLVGTIGTIGLPSPDSLIAVVGRTVPQVRAIPGAAEVWRLNTTPPNDCGDCPAGVGFNKNAIDLILAVVALGMLFPVVIFIGSATRLAAARREQRFAAMRLVGATPRQISVLSAIESSVAVVFGTLAGFGLFFALRPLVARIPFTGDRFFTSDLSLSWLDAAVAAVGIPVVAALAARLALRRVVISPLGVFRRSTPKPPSPWRLWPLFAGILELAYFLEGSRPRTGPGQTIAYLVGFLLVMTGLVTGGPWLTMVSARWLSRRTKRPAALIAGRRLADDPRSGFRAISGLVLALFIGTVAVAVLTPFIAHRGAAKGDPVDASTIVVVYGDQFLNPNSPVPSTSFAGRARDRPAGHCRGERHGSHSRHHYDPTSGAAASLAETRARARRVPDGSCALQPAGRHAGLGQLRAGCGDRCHLAGRDLRKSASRGVAGIADIGRTACPVASDRVERCDRRRRCDDRTRSHDHGATDPRCGRSHDDR